MVGSCASSLDEVIWEWVQAGRPVTLSDAYRYAVIQAQGVPVQVSCETVFTTGGHPLDSIRPIGLLGVERLSHAGVDVLRLVDTDGWWLLAVFPTPHAGVYHLVSGLPTTHPRSQRVDRWVAKARDVSRCYLGHDDFATIGDRLVEWGDVEVVKLAARMVKDGSSVNRGFPAHTESPRPDHREGIAEAESLGAAVRTLTLHVGEALQVHLRRVAGATFYSGSFSLFEEQVLAVLEQATASRRSLLVGRARTTLGAGLRPLTVTLPEPILKSADDTAAVLNEVRLMSNMTMAVFHRNPYLHFAITDEIDGSNFDVTITRPDAIDVYPGYRASVGALARVTQQLGERFGALALEEQRSVSATSIYSLVGN